MQLVDVLFVVTIDMIWKVHNILIGLTPALEAKVPPLSRHVGEGPNMKLHNGNWNEVISDPLKGQSTKMKKSKVWKNLKEWKEF